MSFLRRETAPIRRVAAICAYNRRNCGMYSVDLAAREFFGRHGIRCDLWVTQRRWKTGKLRFRTLRAPSDLDRYDAVVYWGDFQNNPMWGATDYAHRHVRRGDARSNEQAYEGWRQLYLLLKGRLPARIGVYAFGGCFMGMEPYLDDRATRLDVERFFTDVDGVIVRDSLSHRTIAGAFGEPIASKVRLGFDVASLLRGPARSPRGDRRYFVHAFGRSAVEHEAANLVRELEGLLGMKAIPIAWLDPGRGGVTQRRFARNVALISGAAFAVTDIYHFCINCFGQRTTPICLTRAGAVPDGTLSDVKKEVLFEMLECPDLLLSLPAKGAVSEIRDAVLKKATAIACADDGNCRGLRVFERRRDELENGILEAIEAR